MRDIDTVDVAKMAKAKLAQVWPKFKFSVRSKRYSGGSSIDVDWTDGPTTKQVEKIVGSLHGAEFDGMQDLKEYNGRPYGNDYIFCTRHETDEFQQWVMGEVLKKFGPFPVTPVFSPTEHKGKVTIGGYYPNLWGVESTGGIKLDDAFRKGCQWTPAQGFEQGSYDSVEMWSKDYNFRCPQAEVDKAEAEFEQTFKARQIEIEEAKQELKAAGHWCATCNTAISGTHCEYCESRATISPDDAYRMALGA